MRTWYRLQFRVTGYGSPATRQSLSSASNHSTLHKEIAALVGVAPMNKDSGSYTGKRRIRAGCSRIRTVLFMAIMSATQRQSKTPDPVSASIGRRQTTESRHGRLHAKAHHHPQCDDENRTTLEPCFGLNLLTSDHSHGLGGTFVLSLEPEKMRFLRRCLSFSLPSPATSTTYRC
ncbi:transposase [uncultured Abyssibacter sp.]|uniref:transposase n=1 Tax=uncultured Abyssibacter sp. TaxID=2320202 RepID=UPI0032B28363|tara:strand:- start:372 stop:896 length:525 start_codon:yes stop_codon:yes gene_type:complete